MGDQGGIWPSSSSLNRSSSPQNVKPSVFKSRLCVFHAAGRCSHGSACSFAHSAYELNDPKTVICPKMDQFGFCDDLVFGQSSQSACPFAHDAAELKQLPKVVKTALCRYFPQGRCKAGTACRHAHAIDEIDPACLASLYTPDTASLTSLYLTTTTTPMTSGLTTPIPITSGLTTPSPLGSPKAGEESELDLQSLQASLLALALELERLRSTSLGM